MCLFYAILSWADIARDDNFTSLDKRLLKKPPFLYNSVLQPSQLNILWFDAGWRLSAYACSEGIPAGS